jgi:type II secretory pathway pseudopilin PulG
VQEVTRAPTPPSARRRSGVTLVELLVFMALFGVLLAVMASMVTSAGGARRVNDQVNQRATTAETIAQLLSYEIGLAGYRGTGSGSLGTNTFAAPTLQIQRNGTTVPDAITVRYYEDRFLATPGAPVLIEAAYSIGANADGVPSLLRAENGGTAAAVVTGVASIKVALFVRRTGEVDVVAGAGVVPTDLVGLSLDLELVDGTAGRFLINLPNAQTAAFF